jgi:hypothetical protein
MSIHSLQLICRESLKAQKLAISNLLISAKFCNFGDEMSSPVSFRHIGAAFSDSKRFSFTLFAWVLWCCGGFLEGQVRNPFHPKNAFCLGSAGFNLLWVFLSSNSPSAPREGLLIHGAIPSNFISMPQIRVT